MKAYRTLLVFSLITSVGSAPGESDDALLGQRTQPPVQSMFYKAQLKETGNMWDVWLYHHEGTYFLYYLANAGARVSKGQPWNNISLATSPDGVHWTEKGPILKKAEEATWMGTGSTWKSATFDKDGNFYMNFSEEIGERQNIYFAESKDLLNWTRLDGEEYRFVQDERWYEKMKHHSIQVEKPDDTSKTVTMLGNTFDSQNGIILEGRLRLPKDKAAPRSGLFIECVNNQGAAVLVDSAGVAELGSMLADGTGLKVTERRKRDLKRVDREMTFTNPAQFRLLLKGSLMEFYLDDILIESFALPGEASGRIGLINSTDTQGTLKAWK